MVLHVLLIVNKIKLNSTKLMTLLNFSTYSQCIPFIIGLFIYFRRGLDEVQLYLLYAVTSLSALEILGQFTKRFFQNNGVAYNLASIFTLLFFCLLFKKSKFVKSTIINIVLIFFILFVIIKFSFFSSILIFDTTIVIVYSFILIILCAYVLMQMTNGEIEDLFHHPLFWISASTLFFNAVVVTIYSLFPVALIGSDYFSANLWNIHAVLNITANLLYSYAFLCRIQKNFSTQLS